jgi:hypothetical protein
VHTPVRAYAATNGTLNFQARLLSSSGNTVPDGYYNIQFNIYSVSSGGSTLWTETRDYNGGSPDNRVRVVNGYLSVNLGTIDSLADETDINWEDDTWLGMTVRGSTQCAFGSCTPADTEMTPRIKLTAVPYALVAGNVKSSSTNSASTHSENITISSGNALGATSTSGSILLDSGTATGTAGTISIGTANTSGITIGRVGVTTVLQGSLRFNSLNCTGNTSGGALTADASGNISCSDDDNGGGGSTTTLQQAYNNDADTGDTIVALTSADDSLIIQNPASGGTDSSFTLKVENLATGAVEGLRIESAGTGNLFTVRDTTATAQDVFTIADGGNTTFKSQTDSTSALRVQNAAGITALSVDTTNIRLGIGTIAPASTLHVQSITPTIRLEESNYSATSFTDDFNRADNTSLGSNWTERNGDWAINGSKLDDTGSSGTATHIHTNGISYPSADYSVTADVKINSNVSQDSGVIARRVNAGGSDFDGYVLFINDTSNHMRLSKRSGGSYTTLGTYSTTISTGTYYTIKLSVNGNTIKGYLNGVERISVTDSSFTAAGDAGLFRNAGGAGGWYSHYDNFTVSGVPVSTNVGQLRFTGNALNFTDAAALSTSAMSLDFGNNLFNLTTNNTIIKSISDNTTTLQVQNATGTPLLNADTLNGNVSLGLSTYNTGTIAQSGTTITGTGTAFTSTMTGGTITYSDGTSATITYVSGTSLTSSVSKTVTAGSTYSIYYGGLKVTNTGASVLQTTTNSTNAFQIQNASATPIFNVDSVSGSVGVGTSIPGANIHVLGTAPSIRLQDGGTAPVLAFSDDFNRSDSTSLGANWTERNGDFEIFTNYVRLATATPLAVVYNNGGPYTSPDYEVVATMTVNSANMAGLVGRRTNSGGSDFDGYYTFIYPNNGDVDLYKRVAGISTLLGRYDVAISGGSVHTLKLSMNGSSIKVYYDGVERISVVDTAITASGDAGLVTGSAATIAGARWDSFSVNYLTTSTSAAEFRHSGNTLYVQNAGSTNGSLASFDLVNNRLGIGTASPTTTLDVRGNALFKNSTNSTTAFQVQKVDSSVLLNVDTTNGYVIDNGMLASGNNFQNYSFEAGIGTTAGWGSYGTNVTSQTSSANAHTGNKYVQMVADSTFKGIYNANIIEINAGDTYYAEAWVKSTAGTTGSGGMYIEWFDKDLVALSTSSSTLTPPGTTWTLRSINATAPANARYAGVNLYVNNTSTTGTWSFDDAYLSRSSWQAPQLFKNSSNTTSAFQIQNSTSDILFAADTTNNRLKVGNATASAGTDTTLFVVDSAPTTMQPTGVNGGIFYDTTLNKFRCFQNSAWQDCIGSSVSNTYVLGGNSFGQVADIGTNDNFALRLETSGVARITINSGSDANAPGGVGINTTAGSAAGYTMFAVLGSNATTDHSGYLGSFGLTDSAATESGQLYNYALKVDSIKTGAAARGGSSSNGGIFNNIVIQGGSVINATGYHSGITPTGGTISNAFSYAASGTNGGIGASGTVTNYYGYFMNDYNYTLGGSQYGLYVNPLYSATNNYSIYTQSGKVRLGDTIDAYGGFQTAELPVPAAPTVTASGGTGVCTFGYKVTFISAGGGETTASAETTVGLRPATLTSGSKNIISWASNSYARKIYRSSTSGVGCNTTTGLVGTVAAGASSFEDTGQAAGVDAPVINSTSWSSIGPAVGVPGSVLDLYRNTNDTTASILRVKSDVGSAGNVKLSVDANGNLEMDGRLGIGLSADPLYSIDVSSSMGGIRLNRTGTSEAFVYLKNDTASSGGQVRALDSGGLRFTNDTAGTEWMRIASDGKVGIGTASATGQLHVYNRGSNIETNLNIDAQGSSSAQMANIALLTQGNGATQIGNSGTKGYAFSARGNAYTTASQQNDLLLSFYDGTSWAERLTIDSVTGNVGIGTWVNAGSRLDVHSNANTANGNIFRVLSNNGSTDNVKMRVDNEGDLFLDGVITASNVNITSGSADVAEEFNVIDDAVAGHVVSTRGTYNVAKTGAAYDTTTIGVIATQPGFTLSMRDQDGNPVDSDNPKPIALVGRVPVKVSTENGIIVPGDYLTSSTIPGYAMKATKPGRVIGVALTGFSEGATGEVIVFVNPGFYAGPSESSYLQNGGSGALSNLQVTGTAVFNTLNVLGPTTLSNLVVTGNAQVDGKLTVTSIEVGTIKVNGHIVTAGDVPTGEVLGASGAGASYTIDGNDTAGTITITTGSSAITAGDLVKVTFQAPFGKVPKIVLSAQNQVSENAGIFPSNKTLTEYLLRTDQMLPPNTTYIFDYFVIE